MIPPLPPVLPLEKAPSTCEVVRRSLAAAPEELPFEDLTEGEGSCADCTPHPVAPGLTAAVSVDGPGGSGRYWSVTVAQSDGLTGLVLGSTVAWRHLHRVEVPFLPLPWFEDVDGDGFHELLIWDRVFWGGSGSEAEWALGVRVYGHHDGAWRLEPEPTAAWTREVAALYEDPANPLPAALRVGIAEGMRALADGGGCAATEQLRVTPY
ncbi:MAG: hypothetical protein H6739_11785 [Alphaproteobacteria bacterium]|nr:hypothetical protein [Alphaproteobacteria bacterium]